MVGGIDAAIKKAEKMLADAA